MWNCKRGILHTLVSHVRDRLYISVVSRCTSYILTCSQTNQPPIFPIGICCRFGITLLRANIRSKPVWKKSAWIRLVMMGFALYMCENSAWDIGGVPCCMCGKTVPEVVWFWCVLVLNVWKINAWNRGIWWVPCYKVSLPCVEQGCVPYYVGEESQDNCQLQIHLFRSKAAFDLDIPHIN